jgi:hypothetical protein
MADSALVDAALYKIDVPALYIYAAYSKEFRLLTAWYINLNCFSNHQLQWK